jgi:hypothetical protein
MSYDLCEECDEDAVENGYGSAGMYDMYGTCFLRVAALFFLT